MRIKVVSTLKQMAFIVMCVTWLIHMAHYITKTDVEDNSKREVARPMSLRGDVINPIQRRPSNEDVDNGQNPWSLDLIAKSKEKSAKIKQGHENSSEKDENPWIMYENMGEDTGLKEDDQNEKMKENEELYFEDPARDESQVVRNPHPFTFVHTGEYVCKKREVFLLIQVQTTPQGAEQRDIIRQTWGGVDDDDYGVGVRLVFVMGVDDYQNKNYDLEQEAKIYGDIVQEDFIDTYSNLTYKGVAGLRWVHKYCSHAKYLLKTDDNAFVNMPALLKHLKDIHRKSGEHEFILCRTWWKMHVLRGESKWAVEESDYPLPFYPPYCSGLAFIFPVEVALKLYKVSFKVPFFWVDDVYITGMLPYVLGISHTQFIHAYIKPDELDAFKKASWYKYIFVHLDEMDHALQYWQHLLAASKKYPIPEVSYVSPGLIAGNNQTNLLDAPPDEVIKVDFDKYMDKS